MSKRPRKSAIISLGGGLRLISEDHLLAQFAPLDMSQMGLRRFLQALSVPFLEIGNTRFIELTAFQMAIRSISRVGEKDFLGPNSTTRERHGSSGFATSLDTQRFAANWKYILMEVLQSRKYRQSYKQAAAEASEAVQRIIAASVHLRPISALRRGESSIDKELAQEPLSQEELPPEPIPVPQTPSRRWDVLDEYTNSTGLEGEPAIREPRPVRAYGPPPIKYPLFDEELGEWIESPDASHLPDTPDTPP